MCTTTSPQYTAGEAQNRPEAITVTYSDTSIGCSIIRTWTATAIAGNVAYLDQNISTEASPLTISLVSSLILACDSTTSSQQVQVQQHCSKSL